MPTLVAAAWLMATTPPPRRTGTSLLAAQTMAAMAVLWVLYLAQELTRSGQPTQLSWQYVLAGFNS